VMLYWSVWAAAALRQTRQPVPFPGGGPLQRGMWSGWLVAQVPIRRQSS
jgi:hypothetical protein